MVVCTVRAIASGLCAVLLVAATAGPAAAAIDLNGPWSFEITWGGFPAGGCVVTVTQSGSTLGITGCDGSMISLTGTIDPDGGALAASGTAVQCSALSISGTASLASDGFSGTIACDALNGTFTATRCGNDVIDPGEDCDEGAAKLTAANDPCCSLTCTAEPAGTVCGDADACRARVCNATGACTDLNTAVGAPCETDDNVCTNDVCDGGGDCEHLPNTGPCDDGNFCTTERCSMGSCVATCSLCCDAGAGCMPAPGSACKAQITSASSLKLRLDSSGASGQRAAWAWKKGETTTLAELGDPFNATAYAFCVYRPRAPLGAIDMLLAADVPAGAFCLQASSAWESCWQSAGSRGFDFKNPRPENPDSAYGGLRRMSLRAGFAGRAKMKLKAVGSRLRSQVYTGLDPVIVQLRASNGECWETGYVNAPKDLLTMIGPDAHLDYRANRASPSGAFLDAR